MFVNTLSVSIQSFSDQILILALLKIHKMLKLKLFLSLYRDLAHVCLCNLHVYLHIVQESEN